MASAAEPFLSNGRPMKKTNSSTTMIAVPLRTSGEIQAASYQASVDSGGHGEVAGVDRDHVAALLVEADRAADELLDLLDLLAADAGGLRDCASATATETRLTLPVCWRVTETSRPTAKLRL